MATLAPSRAKSLADGVLVVTLPCAYISCRHTPETLIRLHYLVSGVNSVEAFAGPYTCKVE